MTIEYPTVIPANAKTVTTHEGWTLSYAVDTTAPFAINAWNVTSPYPTGEPFWHQPHDLNGNDWADESTAQDFADQHILEQFINPPVAVTPPDVPAPEHIIAAKTILEAAGYVVKEPK